MVHLIPRKADWFSVLLEKIAALIPDNSSLIASYAMPSDRYIDLTLGASGTTYTAPANGWFVVSKKGTADNQYLTMYGNKVYSKLFSATTGSVEINLPVAKGTIVTVSYNVAGATNFFRFVYAEGDR